jgi:hypothetical protein
MRWRYGDTNPVIAAVDSATVIEIGDLVFQDTDDAKPASAQADQGSEEANQERFADAFLGVAMQRSRSGDTDPIRWPRRGLEFDAPGHFELAPGRDENGPAALMNQQVDAAPPPPAIGRVAKGARRHERPDTP